MPADTRPLVRSVELAFSRLARAARRERNRRAAARRLPAILDRLQRSAPSPQPLRVLDTRVTRGGGVLADVGTTDVPVALVKMGVTPAHRRNLRRQARILRLVHAQPSLAALSPLVAVPMLAGDESGWGFLIETWLPGRPPATRAAGNATTVRDALSTIALLHRGTSCPATVGEALLERWVTARVRTVSALLGAGSDVARAEAFARLESELVSRLAGCAVGVGWIHGDYWPGNVRVSESGSIVGVVDWDSLQSRELPLHDSLHYAVTALRLAQGQQWGAMIGGMLNASATEAEELALAELHATAPGVDRRTALLLYWLRGVEANWRRHPAASERPAWLDANVTPVLEVLV